MRNEYLKYGEILPKILLSGSTNPMGLYALYLGKNYAIHGTNVNFGIGLRITRGCIRLRPKDIEYLFNLVPVGTRVQFINEPIKMTIETNGMQYLEVHNPLSYYNDKTKKYYSDIHILSIYIKKIPYLISNNKNYSNINYKIATKTLQKRSGIPINITYDNHNKNK